MRTDRTSPNVNPMGEDAESSACRIVHSQQSVAVGSRRDEGDGEEIDVGDMIRANLLKLRRERGLSLRELSELSEVSLSTLEDLASGKSFPSVELLWKLAHALDLPCTAFIEEPAMATLLLAPSAMRSNFA
jgi:ribosome-binding protein aMBF1 (putative translation factor)